MRFVVSLCGISFFGCRSCYLHWKFDSLKWKLMLRGLNRTMCLGCICRIRCLNGIGYLLFSEKLVSFKWRGFLANSDESIIMKLTDIVNRKMSRFLELVVVQFIFKETWPFWTELASFDFSTIPRMLCTPFVWQTGAGLCDVIVQVFHFPTLLRQRLMNPTMATTSLKIHLS